MEATEDTEGNGRNEECAEFTSFDVLFDVFDVFDVLDVLFDVLLVTPSIVLVVVSGSTLRAWKTITLSSK